MSNKEMGGNNANNIVPCVNYGSGNVMGNELAELHEKGIQLVVGIRPGAGQKKAGCLTGRWPPTG
jgi:hypothetical protein